MLATSGEAGIDGIAPGECGPLREEEERRGAARRWACTRSSSSATATASSSTGCTCAATSPGRSAATARGLVTINHHERSRAGGANMADHRVVGAAPIDAARDAGNRWVFPELLERGSRALGRRAPRLRRGVAATAAHAVDVTGYVDAGIASLREHRAYLDGLPADSFGTDPDTFLRGMAEQTGARFGGRPAVGFELIQL